MKKAMLLLLLAISGFAHAQTLKEALFSGKLKNDAGAVIRKGDDLSTKIDTTTHAVTSTTNPVTPPNTAVTSATDQKDNSTSTTDTATTVPVSTESSAAPKNNNALMKTYMDSVVSTLKSEVVTSKKIKHGSYFVLITYAIGTDGQTTVTDVSVSPENGFLQQQIKARLDSDTPKLSPVLNGAGTPRKAIKKYNFTLAKE